MSVKEVTYYVVECDARGCDQRADGGEYTAWDCPEGATNEAECLDWAVVKSKGEHYCPDHLDRACIECGETEGIELAPEYPEGDGWPYCAEHRPEEAPR